jgi:hypothetical protein
MPDKRYSKILQILRRQTRQDSVVDLILAECRLIFFEAKTPQPTRDVHGGVPYVAPDMIAQASDRV